MTKYIFSHYYLSAPLAYKLNPPGINLTELTSNRVDKCECFTILSMYFFFYSEAILFQTCLNKQQKCLIYPTTVDRNYRTRMTS